jgi:hypothetical protein
MPGDVPGTLAELDFEDGPPPPPLVVLLLLAALDLFAPALGVGEHFLPLGGGPR